MDRQCGPRPKDVTDLVRDLLLAQDKPTAGKAEQGEELVGRGRAIFLVGAGCSVSAGIPLASAVAKRAVVKLAKDYMPMDPLRSPARDPADPIEALEALVDYKHVPRRFKPESQVARWGELYSYLFSEHIKHPNHQREFITGLVGTREFELNWSHACLGELVSQRFVHTVLTTNFDQLVLKGIIRTGIVPVVADGLESLSRISASPRWPQVVHVHGSMHTYELRNSNLALVETEDDRGLQSLMYNVLKETTVLVVVGYSGGEEGIMRLLQDAAKALPRMVVYWIANEPDFAQLSERARAFLSVGEYKYFVLNQDADDFFNQLLGELGIGSPTWVRQPVEALRRQVTIKSVLSTPEDVKRLIGAYEKKVATVARIDAQPDPPMVEATRLRSAKRFADAVSIIEKDEGFRNNVESLSIHARSLLDQYNQTAEADVAMLHQAIKELDLLVDTHWARELRKLNQRVAGTRMALHAALGCRGAPEITDRPALLEAIQEAAAAAANATRLMLDDVEKVIEARRDLYEKLDAGRGKSAIADDLWGDAGPASDAAAQVAIEKLRIVSVIERHAGKAQGHVLRPRRTVQGSRKAGRRTGTRPAQCWWALRGWAVMEFYKAEAAQLSAELLKHSRSRDVAGREEFLQRSRTSYEDSLQWLAQVDMELSRECKEGLAGALANLAELPRRTATNRNYLRQAKTLYQEVVAFAQRNDPGKKLAGALENLAGIVESTLSGYPEEARNARDEAQHLLQSALAIYQDEADAHGVKRMQDRLEGLPRV